MGQRPENRPFRRQRVTHSTKSRQERWFWADLTNRAHGTLLKRSARGDSGINFLDRGTSRLALGHPLIHRQSPPAQPTCRNTNSSHIIPCMCAHTYRHRQQITNQGLNAPGLRIIGQVQNFQADHYVVGQRRHGIESLIRNQLLAGWVVQIQTAKHLAEGLFFAPLELVPFKDSLGRVLVSRAAHPISIPPE